MNIGLPEFIIVLLNLILLLAIPAIIVLVVIILFRRIQHLESRVSNLEEMRDSDTNNLD
jgi:hypothetical protein